MAIDEKDVSNSSSDVIKSQLSTAFEDGVDGYGNVAIKAVILDKEYMCKSNDPDEFHFGTPTGTGGHLNLKRIQKILSMSLTEDEIERIKLVLKARSYEDRLDRAIVHQLFKRFKSKYEVAPSDNKWKRFVFDTHEKINAELDASENLLDIVSKYQTLKEGFEVFLSKGHLINTVQTAWDTSHWMFDQNAAARGQHMYDHNYWHVHGSDPGMYGSSIKPMILSDLANIVGGPEFREPLALKTLSCLLYQSMYEAQIAMDYGVSPVFFQRALGLPSNYRHAAVTSSPKSGGNPSDTLLGYGPQKLTQYFSATSVLKHFQSLDQIFKPQAGTPMTYEDVIGPLSRPDLIDGSLGGPGSSWKNPLSHIVPFGTYQLTTGNTLAYLCSIIGREMQLSTGLGNLQAPGSDQPEDIDRKQAAKAVLNVSKLGRVFSRRGNTGTTGRQTMGSFVFGTDEIYDTNYQSVALLPKVSNKPQPLTSLLVRPTPGDPQGSRFMFFEPFDAADDELDGVDRLAGANSLKDLFLNKLNDGGTYDLEDNIKIFQDAFAPMGVEYKQIERVISELGKVQFKGISPDQGGHISSLGILSGALQIVNFLLGLATKQTDALGLNQHFYRRAALELITFTKMFKTSTDPLQTDSHTTLKQFYLRRMCAIDAGHKFRKAYGVDSMTLDELNAGQTVPTNSLMLIVKEIPGLNYNELFWRDFFFESMMYLQFATGYNYTPGDMLQDLVAYSTSTGSVASDPWPEDDLNIIGAGAIPEFFECLSNVLTTRMGYGVTAADFQFEATTFKDTGVGIDGVTTGDDFINGVFGASGQAYNAMNLMITLADEIEEKIHACSSAASQFGGSDAFLDGCTAANGMDRAQLLALILEMVTFIANSLVKGDVVVSRVASEHADQNSVGIDWQTSFLGGTWSHSKGKYVVESADGGKVGYHDMEEWKLHYWYLMPKFAIGGFDEFTPSSGGNFIVTDDDHDGSNLTKALTLHAESKISIFELQELLSSARYFMEEAETRTDLIVPDNFLSFKESVMEHFNNKALVADLAYSELSFEARNETNTGDITLGPELSLMDLYDAARHCVREISSIAIGFDPAGSILSLVKRTMTGDFFKTGESGLIDMQWDTDPFHFSSLVDGFQEAVSDSRLATPIIQDFIKHCSRKQIRYAKQRLGEIVDAHYTDLWEKENKDGTTAQGHEKAGNVTATYHSYIDEAAKMLLDEMKSDDREHNIVFLGFPTSLVQGQIIRAINKDARVSSTGVTPRREYEINFDKDTELTSLFDYESNLEPIIFNAGVSVQKDTIISAMKNPTVSELDAGAGPPPVSLDGLVEKVIFNVENIQGLIPSGWGTFSTLGAVLIGMSTDHGKMRSILKSCLKSFLLTYIVERVTGLSVAAEHLSFNQHKVYSRKDLIGCIDLINGASALRLTFLGDSTATINSAEVIDSLFVEDKSHSASINAQIDDPVSLTESTQKIDKALTPVLVREGLTTYFKQPVVTQKIFLLIRALLNTYFPAASSIDSAVFAPGIFDNVLAVHTTDLSRPESFQWQAGTSMSSVALTKSGVNEGQTMASLRSDIQDGYVSIDSFKATVTTKLGNE